MEHLHMDGYRQWLDKAIRVDQDRDWSVHTIDYSAFKRNLTLFSNRRAQLRRALTSSKDDSILASEFDEFLGPPPRLPMGGTDREGTSLLLPTPSANATSNLLEACTNGWHASSDPTSVPETHIHYRAFTDPKSEGGGGDFDVSPQPHQRVPFHIDTDVASRSSFFWGPPRVKRLAVFRQVSNFERNDMMIFLALELDKAAMFYMAQWQLISQQLLDYQNSVPQLQFHRVGNGINQIADPVLQQIGKELLELEAFVVVNLVTVRQMLIRYDAFARSLDGTPMSDYYMKFMMNPGLRFWEADSPDGALSHSFRKLIHHVELLALSEKFEDVTSALQYYELNERFCYQRMEFAMVLESSEREQMVASTGHAAPVRDTFLLTLRHYFLVGMIEDRLGYEPTYLTSRGKSLSKEMRTMATWRRKYSGQWGDEAIVEEPEESVAFLGRQERFNLIMALLAAFLYCMNYYIVEPSSTMYVNALGGQDALSGSLIGMMPMASFLAAIAYSNWTNHSFRHPFMVSCFLMLAGNLIYSYAYERKSLFMAFAGRFITGLGGPKCIVRRYMADTTSISIRTSVNAGFGMVVAAGSAFGPGCAILLSRLNFSITVPGGVKLLVNGMTGPGYLMASLWTLFTIALCIQFTEPDRSGLEEQKRLEGMKLKPEPMGDESLKNHNMQAQHDAQGHLDDSRIFSSGRTSMSFDGDVWKDEEDDEDMGLSLLSHIRSSFGLVTLPMRICLGLLFAKVFVIETLVSSTSTLSKNRYQWQVREVGILGCVNGLVVIPLSILVGRLSMSYPDRVLMMWLLGIGLVGILRLIDLTDLLSQDEDYYGNSFFAVGPTQYIIGYFTIYMSIQSFEGIVGSTLSKVVPTALASGTLNSGLLATLVDTFARTCGDLFICLCGFMNLRELINLLFIPGAIILATCLVVVRKYYDLLAV